MQKNNFYKKKLKNGLTVLFEKRNSSVVSVSSTIKFGAAYEDENIKGISHVIEHLVFKGTESRTQKQISEEIEKKGGILNAFTSEEITSFWNKLPAKHLEIGLEIVSDLMLNPKFDETEFEKEKNVIIEELKMYKDNPMRHSIEKIKEMLYKKPFGTDIAGTPETVKNLKRNQIVDLHEKTYSTSDMILCIVGNTDFNKICEIAEKIYPPTKRKPVNFATKKINKNQVEKRHGIDQSHFVFGFHSPSLTEKQRYANEILIAYLSEGMSSRFHQEIREKKGLAYAIKGFIENGKNFGYNFIYTGTLKEKIHEIKKIILKELKEIKNMKKQDLEQVKEQLIGLREVEGEDSINAMTHLLIEESAGSAQDYYKYKENISKTSLEDVKKIAKIKSFSTFSLVPK